MYTESSLALLTDLYQLSMAYGYWKEGIAQREAVFHLFFRRQPFQGGFTIASGLQAAVEYLQNLRFDDSDIEYLRSLVSEAGRPLFEAPFFDYLRQLRFTCSLDAVPEGTALFPYEPIVRVQGPLLQAQLCESPLLNLINFPTLIATKAARVCLAAEGDPVLEFGMRRAQGMDGALTASRASYVGGCFATSHLLAGKKFGIPVRGTHAHSWVMAFDTEQHSFEAFARAMPDNCVFLVDTYNSLKGVEHAIAVGHALKAKGKKLLGIRLDSGDLAHISKEARRQLDEAGFSEAKIFASNELDEVVISELKRQGAKIDVWGVGTHLVTGRGQTALDGVYKISALKNSQGEWDYLLKLSEQLVKISNPGVLQARRFSQGGLFIADMLYDEHISVDRQAMVDPFDPTHQTQISEAWSFEDLLVPIFREGKLVYTLPSLSAIQKRTKDQLARLPLGVKRFLNPHQYPVGMEEQLFAEKVSLIRKWRV